MDDQLELHMQRCLEDENDSSNEDSDLQQLLALQSSSYAATTNEEIAETSSVTKQVGGSSIEEEEEEDLKRQRHQELDTQPQSPKSLLDSQFDCHTTPFTKTAEGPPITIGTDRFLRMVRLLERQFESPISYMEVLIKMLWAIPVVFLLGDHFGWIWSLQWAVIGILVLRELKHDGDYINKSTVDTSRPFIANAAVKPVNEEVQKQQEQKKVLEAAKAKASHLLGLAGAPPPLWTLELDHQSTGSDDDKFVANLITTTTKVETNQDNTEQDNKAETDISTVLPSLVHFVESHVQFLLTIDQALDYLRTSASIHMGLGPQSQCAERVEQAAMAREFRQHNKANMTKNRALEPQRGPTKSVLSLVALRRNLARSMVHQSATLDAFWKHLYARQEGDIVDNEDYFQHNSQGKEPLLEMPHVVNLAWIKGTRHILAESLTGTVEEIFFLLQPSEEKGIPDASRIRCWLEDADAQTRQLTQYLRGALLLPSDAVVEDSSTTARSVGNPNDPLFRTLLNFRTQLDALGTALWSCQQYCNLSSDQDDDASLVDNSSLSQKEWWSKIQQMSETCQAFETEITQIYFPPEFDFDESDAESNGTNSDAQHNASQETGDYVHGESKSNKQDVEGDPKKDKPTKTVVFSGKGNVEDRPKKSGRKGERKTGAGSEAMDSGIGLLQRDTVSELAMVSELQNRIKALIQDEEIEEVELNPEEEKAAKLAREPTAPLFLGASGSLLAELKQSIPTMGVLGSEIGDINEEIIGED